jgi:hypothetical protein
LIVWPKLKRNFQTSLTSKIQAHEAATFESEEDRLQKTEGLLRTLKSRFFELADGTKPWASFKQRGRNALPDPLRTEFDRLLEICSARGFFINPCGELESMLTDYGIDWTTDKRSWIVRALQLLPNLSVDEKKYPWKLMESIHSFLLRQV